METRTSKMPGKIKSISIVFFIKLLLFGACSEIKEGNQIIVYYGCKEVEKVQDLDLSIENNKKLFEQLKVKVVLDTMKTECGYLLKKGHEELKLSSVLTDVDLMLAIKKFFE